MMLLMGAVSATAMDNSAINNQWRKKTISVKGGGDAPGIITLLKAFNGQYNVWSVGEVLKQADNPAPTTRQNGTALIYDSDDDYRILVDRRNGYVDLESETDISQMQACVWRKNNGHKVFAISLHEENSPVPNLLCWYDYDPATQTMKPERSPLDDFKPSSKGAYIMWHLPMKGTDFEIYEYYNLLSTPLKHIYKWDRERFSLTKTLLNGFQYFPSAGSTHYEMLHPGCEWTHYAMVDLGDDSDPVLLLGQIADGKVLSQLMIASFKGDLVNIGEASADYGEIHVYQLPQKSDAQRLAVQYRDKAGGYWYSIIENCYVQFTISDLPNFMSPEEGNLIEVAAGYGRLDESTDILDQLGPEVDLLMKTEWNPVEIVMEEYE